MISNLATKVVDKGKTKRAKVGGILVHTTGSGIVERAKKEKADPFEFTCEFYKRYQAYPHYMIGWNGEIVSFCDEMKWAAHARWSDAEKAHYKDRLSWMKRWAKSGGNATSKVAPEFYIDWVERWTLSNLEKPYFSPLDILGEIGGGIRGPNHAYVGIELLHQNPFTEAQHKELARLVIDIAHRHNIGDIDRMLPGELPTPWLCSHSDVSPMRRWAAGGFAFDTRKEQLDWIQLARNIYTTVRS